MPMRDLWHSTLVYFGVREDDWDEEYDDDGAAANEDLERTYSERPNVRRLKPRRGGAGAARLRGHLLRRGAPRAVSARRRPPDGAPPDQRAHGPRSRSSLVVPKSFNDAQTVADKLKADVPVIINFQGADADLAKRLVDFSSGLTYALDGSMQRVADRVFLLTPHSISVSAEDKALLMERGFFNQY